MEYFLLRQGAVFGPYSVPQVQAFIAEGRVLLTDFARTPDLAQWQPLHLIWIEQMPLVWPVPPPPVPPPPAPWEPAASPQSAALGNALTWPFHQRAWFEGLWMTMLWWFPVPLLPLGGLANIGWSIDAARQRASCAPDLLPRPERVGRMLLDGLTVVFFFCLYFLVPVTLAWMTTALQPMDFIVPAAKWSWHFVRGDLAGNLADIIEGVFWRYVRTRALIVLYLLLAWPLFTAAGIRFVLTREAASFVHLPSCFRILFLRLGAFLKFLILAGLTTVAITVADVLAASTGIGAPLTIALGAAGIWVLTDLFANLAMKVQPKLQSYAEVQLANSAAGQQGPVR